MSADEDERGKFVLVKSMEASSFVLLDKALPAEGSSRSSIPSQDLEALGTSLKPINQKITEAGVLTRELLEANGMVDMHLFGVLDDRSNKDQIMLLVKREYDVPRDAEDQIIRPEWGEPEEDVLTWQTLRVYFDNAMEVFMSFTIAHITDFKDGRPGSRSCCDEAGVFRTYRSLRSN